MFSCNIKSADFLENSNAFQVHPEVYQQLTLRCNREINVKVRAESNTEHSRE